MALTVKSVDATVKKWQARANVAGGDYAAGVAASGTRQSDNAVANKANWAAGVQAAASNDAYAKGLAKDPGKYQRNVAAKGAARYGPGVSAAAPDYSKGIGPVLSTLSSLSLPPRQPRGSPSNLQRVQIVDAALRALKTGA